MRNIDKLILCSPYKEPYVHWNRNVMTQEFYQEEGRRPAGYTIAGGELIELPWVNDIRQRMAKWELEGRKGLTGVTNELLEHWETTDKEFRQFPFFFCQLEAIKTIIFLNEAPDNYKTGIEIRQDGGDFIRWCSKMATGSGKTTVMAMLIAYNVLNKVSYKLDQRFSKNILIVAPGLTVKSRLAVLQPSHENNYYDQFNIVPSTLMDNLRQGNLKIVNWHMLAWDTQEKLDQKKEKGQIRSVDKRKTLEISDTVYAKQVLDDMANTSNILVINDEAHHAWRTPAESKEKSKKKEEIDNTVWVQGLDRLHKKNGILRCHDFTATPFSPGGKKAEKDALFTWIISDFGLNDAIESGLVKTPRVVIRDDSNVGPDYKSRLYHIYKDKEVSEDLNQKQIPKETPLPDLVKMAYELLGTDWLRTKRDWQQTEGIDIPPVMITIANTTFTSDRIKYHFDSKSCEVKELCEVDKTLQIDSKIIGRINNEDETLTGSLKEQAESLREMVDTVGKKGKPGEQIQNVISVSMLTEGWDANNVTHIMGLRAFSSQLLCEQVIGRGLRRVSYDFDEEGMLEPEYVNIFGVPFEFIPHEGGSGIPKPPKPKVQIEPIPEKQEFEISFPNILRIDTLYESSLSIDYDELDDLELNPEEVITEAEMGGVMQGNITPAALTEVDIKKFEDNYRLQTIIFKVATRIFVTEKPNWKGDQHDFLAQLISLTKEFLNSDKIIIKNSLFSQDLVRRNILLLMNMGKIIHHFWNAIRDQNDEARTLVFDKEKPIRSTSDMPTWYSAKPNLWMDKTHINYTVFDSTWEANNAKIIDRHEKVKSFIKNDHLGFFIKYNYRGIIKNFLPDYIIQMVNGDKLILEVKGQDSHQNRVKRDFLNLWIEAVNQNGKFGKWYWAVVFNSSEVQNILDDYESFPTAPFLPEIEVEAEILGETLIESSKALSNVFNISPELLEGASSFQDMVQVLVKELVTVNLNKIVETIKTSLKDSEEEFIDDTEIQSKIYSVLDGITPNDTRVYDSRIRNWLKDSKKLHKRSFSYLLSGEYIFDTLIRHNSQDFSPFVLQCSRSVENELLTKVFAPFIEYVHERDPNVEETYSQDLASNRYGLLAKLVVKQSKTFTLGNMKFALRELNQKHNIDKSAFLIDFDRYTKEQFSEDIYEPSILDDLDRLQKDFRNKSAHTGTIDKDRANDCKFLVRKILAKFLNVF
ncbi:BPTD_3080 family restriction endonuclease [Flagellimonas iocasae]|uniref:BPTD_3080 family restriction endonuclease n=1 Tax=Flagellimonas iocasae TaxID=2055905 RepID=A0ABW4XX98_9FLAO